MGITFLTVGGLLAPFQQFISWLGAVPSARDVAPRRARVGQPTQAMHGKNRAHPSWPPAARASALPACRPLRVLRVMDPCNTPASAGRMVISGRMADVCAELDRLAALEANRG